MSVSILKNNIATPQFAAAIQSAIRGGIGEIPGHWRAWIEESQNSIAWTIKIDGPNGFQWEHEFFGQEQTPEFIEREIKEVLTRGTPRSPGSRQNAVSRKNQGRRTPRPGK